MVSSLQHDLAAKLATKGLSWGRFGHWLMGDPSGVRKRGKSFRFLLPRPGPFRGSRHPHVWSLLLTLSPYMYATRRSIQRKPGYARGGTALPVLLPIVSSVDKAMTRDAVLELMLQIHGQEIEVSESK